MLCRGILVSCALIWCSPVLVTSSWGQGGSPPLANDFQVTTLAKGGDKTGEPIAMAVLPDRRVLHTSRGGRVWLTTPKATTSLAGTIPVYTHDEDGLQGIAIDATFETNRWVYVYYAPLLSTPPGAAPHNGNGPSAFEPHKGHNQLSRIKLKQAGTLDLSTEQMILQVPADRGICCHAGGEIDFDAQGNLYLSTGDDTNPFESDGYSPIDERFAEHEHDWCAEPEQCDSTENRWSAFFAMVSQLPVPADRQRWSESKKLLTVGVDLERTQALREIAGISDGDRSPRNRGRRGRCR